jgi:hypothetical protein
MSTQNTTSQILIGVLAVEEQIQKKYELVKEHQLWNEIQQQWVQDTTEELEQLLKETFHQRTKGQSIQQVKQQIDDLTTERDRIIDLTEEDLEKDERETQLKLSLKEPKVKAIKERPYWTSSGLLNIPRKRQMKIRTDRMFEGVSHIVAHYGGKEKHGYLDPEKFGKVKQFKFFWNEDDNKYHTPNSLHASLRMEIDDELVQRDVWRDCEITVYYAGDKEPTTIGDLDLLHTKLK